MDGSPGQAQSVRNLLHLVTLPGQPDETIAIALAQGPHGCVVHGLETYE
jgi:hypothetical protein